MDDDVNNHMEIILSCFSAHGKEHLFAHSVFLVNRAAFVCAYFLEPSRESEVRLVADAPWPSVTISLSCVRILRFRRRVIFLFRLGLVSVSPRRQIRMPMSQRRPSIVSAVNNGVNPPKFVAAEYKILKYGPFGEFRFSSYCYLLH